MSNWTRRRLLKASLTASASAVAGKSIFPWAHAQSAHAGQSSIATAPPAQAAQLEDQVNTSSLRERILLDPGWRFHFGHAWDPAKDFNYGAMANLLLFAKSGNFPDVTRLKFDDSSWRTVDLPHDWAVELPFKNAPELHKHGGKPVGRDYPETSIGWYRRVFDLETSDSGQRIAVEFDGAFRDATVVFNGFYLGENHSGYAPFRFDLTDFANFGGKNVLAVRVDATLGEGWFYEGAGLYRHVWLTKTSTVHVAQWGTFVRSEVQGRRASLSITTEVENESEREQLCRVVSRIVNAQLATVASVASEPRKISAGERTTFESHTVMDRPQLWSLEEPNLYRLVTAIEAGQAVVDETETTFGIRSIRFDPDKGFFLNGKALKIKGTCNHQDHAGVGTALPDRLHYYRIERLKEMGSNAYRTAHNPPAPELLDACDRLGMLVMDETRMLSSTPQGLSQLERMIRRDRNHPSIVVWSLGNEEWSVQGNDHGRRIVEAMRRLAHRLDPSRPVTVGMDSGYSAGKGITRAVDLQGFNYQREDLDAFHRSFPTLPTIGTETASTYSTRGVYRTDATQGYVSAYDVNRPGYAATAEQWWSFYADRDFLAGGFVWTGFDYRGEPSPYGWPCISSHFGVMDICGFPKDNYFYYQAWWSAKPVLHLFPHWNWEGREGEAVDVWCHTNLKSVELFLNGESQGVKQVSRNSHVEWKVKYSPGVLEARGSQNGQVVLTAKRETAGPAARIALRPDRQTIAADGADVLVLSVEIIDSQGRPVSTASNQIAFTIDGRGRLIGLGNGDPTCHEADKPMSPGEGQRSAFNGLCMALVQALKQKGDIRVSATSPGLQGDSIMIRTLS